MSAFLPGISDIIYLKKNITTIKAVSLGNNRIVFDFYKEATSFPVVLERRLL